jgi:hypothetical protein
VTHPWFPVLPAHPFTKKAHRHTSSTFSRCKTPITFRFNDLFFGLLRGVSIMTEKKKEASVCVCVCLYSAAVSLDPFVFGLVYLSIIIFCLYCFIDVMLGPHVLLRSLPWCRFMLVCTEYMSSVLMSPFLHSAFRSTQSHGCPFSCDTMYTVCWFFFFFNFYINLSTQNYIVHREKWKERK